MSSGISGWVQKANEQVHEPLSTNRYGSYEKVFGPSARWIPSGNTQKSVHSTCTTSEAYKERNRGMLPCACSSTWTALEVSGTETRWEWCMPIGGAQEKERNPRFEAQSFRDVSWFIGFKFTKLIPVSTGMEFLSAPYKQGGCLLFISRLLQFIWQCA